MPLNAWMRRFTIRFRMWAALCVVMVLVCVLGGMGLYGMARIYGMSEQSMHQSKVWVGQMNALRTDLNMARRHDKDMIIQYETPTEIALIEGKWYLSANRVDKLVAAMLEGEEDEDNPLAHEALQELAAYEAATAKVLVVAVDEPEQSLKIIDLVQQHFPRLPIVARARDVTHWYQLRDRGVLHMEREVFESSLRSGCSVLELLGHPPEQAQQATQRFRQHNLQLLEQMYPHHRDRAKLIAVAKQGRQQLEEQMARERELQRAEDTAPTRPPTSS